MKPAEILFLSGEGGFWGVLKYNCDFDFLTDLMIFRIPIKEKADSTRSGRKKVNARSLKNFVLPKQSKKDSNARNGRQRRRKQTSNIPVISVTIIQQT